MVPATLVSGLLLGGGPRGGVNWPAYVLNLHAGMIVGGIQQGGICSTWCYVFYKGNRLGDRYGNDVAVGGVGEAMGAGGGRSLSTGPGMWRVPRDP